VNAVVVSVREQLEVRAGASDTDREAWLSERFNGVTATEIRDLYLGKVTKEALASKKVARVFEDDLSHVPIIGWGRTREPIIARAIEREHGIAPESRVFGSAENPRWLASPDGVGIDFDERVSIAEIKTAGMDISVGSRDFERKGYLAQMVWAMGVVGAYRCRYEWEYRLGEPWEGFTPGQRQGEWVMFADHQQLWLDLTTLADDFLAELDRQAAGVPTLKHPALIRAEHLMADYVEQKARSEANLAGLRARIDEAMQEAGVEKFQVEGVGTASVSVSKPSKRFDSAALRKAEPALYARFQKDVPGGERTLRLTPAKQSTEEVA
jgi:hypothetical protein